MKNLIDMNKAKLCEIDAVISNLEREHSFLSKQSFTFKSMVDGDGNSGISLDNPLTNGKIHTGRVLIKGNSPFVLDGILIALLTTDSSDNTISFFTGISRPCGASGVGVGDLLLDLAIESTGRRLVSGLNTNSEEVFISPSMFFSGGDFSADGPGNNYYFKFPENCLLNPNEVMQIGIKPYLASTHLSLTNKVFVSLVGRHV